MFSALGKCSEQSASFVLCGSSITQQAALTWDVNLSYDNYMVSQMSGLNGNNLKYILLALDFATPVYTLNTRVLNVSERIRTDFVICRNDFFSSVPAAVGFWDTPYRQVWYRELLWIKKNKTKNSDSTPTIVLFFTLHNGCLKLFHSDLS